MCKECIFWNMIFILVNNVNCFLIFPVMFWNREWYMYLFSFNNLMFILLVSLTYCTFYIWSNFKYHYKRTKETLKDAEKSVKHAFSVNLFTRNNKKTCTDLSSINIIHWLFSNLELLWPCCLLQNVLKLRSSDNSESFDYIDVYKLLIYICSVQYILVSL